MSTDRIVSTDPPYYDNIGYADLSDFFYVWMRRSQKPVFPDLFATLAVPKAEELVAIGGDVIWEFRPRLLSDGKPRDGMVGSMVYRYQRMVAGQAPDIDRFDATLKYRWWAKDLAFDLGFTYSDGTEPKSLADENKVSITFGVLY